MDPLSPFWTGRRAFVSGCSGFLGTWVVRELLARGAAVSGLVRADAPPDSQLLQSRLHRDIRVVRGRADDAGRLRSVFATHEPAVVFHLTAPLLRLDRAVFAAAGAACPTPPVVVPVPAGGPPARKALTLRLAADTGCRVAVAGLPTVWGAGDRRPDGLAARAATDRFASFTPSELSEPHLGAADAARELVRFAEQAATDPGLCGRPVDLRPDPPVTGADVVAMLTGGSFAPFAAADALAWYRGRAAAPAAARRAA